MPALPSRHTLSLLERAMRENGGRLPQAVYDTPCEDCGRVSICKHKRGERPAYVSGGPLARRLRGLKVARTRPWRRVAPRGTEARQEICRNAAIARHQRAQWAARDAQEVAT